mmetsp:Transcript_21135/g.24475  ORF Transcript_21135/g.24475 Transcript_21135/m.24475 type:complete len:99 (+) Transcript_21135:235-531(+)
MQSIRHSRGTNHGCDGDASIGIAQQVFEVTKTERKHFDLIKIFMTLSGEAHLHGNSETWKDIRVRRTGYLGTLVMYWRTQDTSAKEKMDELLKIQINH